MILQTNVTFEHCTMNAGLDINAQHFTICTHSMQTLNVYDTGSNTDRIS